MLDALAYRERGLECATMRVALYARYSSNLQDKRSIADQLALARDHASRQGWKVVATFHDAAISGISMLNRPGLQDLMHRAEEGEFDVVLTESLDRLARNQASIATIYQELEFLRVRIVTLADGEVSEMHIGLKGTMSALFLRDLGQKVRRGHKGRVREGHVAAGRLPYGYLWKDRRPVIDEDKAVIVRRIVAHYLAGVGTDAIAKALNAEGISGPGGGPWTRGAILGARTRASGILSNPIYKGQIVYGRRSQPKDPRTGRTVSRSNPRVDWTVSENRELCIIDAETWDAVQEARSRNAHPHPRHHRRPRHLLSGLLYCSLCGGKLTVRRHTARGAPYFVCASQDKGRLCANRRMVQGPEIERRVLVGLYEKLLSPEAIEFAIEVYRKERARLAAERTKSRDSTERELGDVRRRIANISRDIGQHGGSRTLSRELRELEARERALEAKLPTNGPDVVELHPQVARRYREIVEDLSKTLTGPEPERARAIRLVRSLITRVIVVPTAARAPVGLEVTGDLLALIAVDGSARREAASQVASIAITA